MRKDKIIKVMVREPDKSKLFFPLLNNVTIGERNGSSSVCQIVAQGNITGQ